MAQKSNVTINGQDAKVILAHYKAIPCLVQALKNIAGTDNSQVDLKEIARQGLANWDKNRAKSPGDVTVRANVVNGG